jgi:hypothetical protein
VRNRRFTSSNHLYGKNKLHLPQIKNAALLHREKVAFSFLPRALRFYSVEAGSEILHGSEASEEHEAPGKVAQESVAEEGDRGGIASN